jgi:glycosyltransferase involved in cell wall biosynthesis
MTTDRTRLVLHVINSLGLSGGAEQQLVTNLDHFEDPRIRHHVAYLYSVTDPSWLDTMSTPITALNGQPGHAPLPVSGVRLLRLVRELRPDLIHCSLADSALISRLVGRVTGTPVLESLVNISHEPIRAVDSAAVRPWKLQMHRGVDRLTIGNVTAFHALTDEVARSWVDTVGIDPATITVIPRGLSFDLLDGAALEGEQRLALRRELADDAEVLVLAVGREEPQKGHRYLLEAMSEVVAGGVDARLVMMGRRGSSTAAIVDQIETLGLGDRVTRLGVRSDVYRHMSAADMLVFPSLFEGLGVSLLEAMGCGLPVVVFDRPPMNQLVDAGETGLVVPERDPGALADAIRRLASDPGLRSDLGAKAARKARESYGIANTAGRLENLYRTLLFGPDGKTPG